VDRCITAGDGGSTIVHGRAFRTVSDGLSETATRSLLLANTRVGESIRLAEETSMLSVTRRAQSWRCLRRSEPRAKPCTHRPPRRVPQVVRPMEAIGIALIRRA